MSDPIIIDTHLHLFYTREEGLSIQKQIEVWEFGTKTGVHSIDYGGDPKEALESIENAGVNQAIVLGLLHYPGVRDRYISGLPEDLNEEKRQDELIAIEQKLAEEVKTFNFWICETAAKYPQFVPFINTDPSLFSIEEADSHIRELVENHGARGIKLHNTMQGFYMHHESMIPVLRTCEELNLPIIAHSGCSKGDEEYAEPNAFAEILRILPGLRLVLAHLGGGAWRQLRQFAEDNPGVFFDCSEIIEWTGSEKGPTDQELARLILDVGPERVMMGSDFPWYDIAHTVERVMELPLISKEQKEAMLGANAKRILKLD
jgi:predicted TIM-barrel fold metal-dependent hydrolase